MPDRFLPIARTEELIVQEMGPETLVFDRRTDIAHNLSPIASLVWALCDGKHDVESLVAAVAEIEPADPQAATAAALAELGEQELLVDGVSRRETVKKMAKLAAGAFSVPLVVSVMAPTVAMAISGQNQFDYCTGKGTNYCKSGTTCTSGKTSGTGVELHGTTTGNSYCVNTSNSATCIADGYSTANNACTASLCCSGACNGLTGANAACAGHTTP